MMDNCFVAREEKRCECATATRFAHIIGVMNAHRERRAAHHESLWVQYSVELKC